MVTMRKKQSQIGKHDTHQTPGEKFWTRRIREIEQLRQQWHNENIEIALATDERERRLSIRAATHDAQVLCKEEDMDRREQLLKLNEETQNASQLALATRLGITIREEAKVEKLKEAMLGAIAMIDTDAVLYDAPIGRALRKVRLASPDEAVPDESS